jgi:hypothetical protein
MGAGLAAKPHAEPIRRLPNPADGSVTGPSQLRTLTGLREPRAGKRTPGMGARQRRNYPDPAERATARAGKPARARTEVGFRGEPADDLPSRRTPHDAGSPVNDWRRPG